MSTTASNPTTRVDATPATRLLAQWTADLRNEDLTEHATTWARHALLDWLAVSLAGAQEPLVRMLVDAYGASDQGPCLVLGHKANISARDAALINGSAGHALDFDDVASRMYGHPSVPVVPAALALAQERNASGADLLRAIVIGHEVESRVGEMVGPSHYLHGFHATGTVGTLGAAAACASLLRLNAEQTAHALGLAATQAAGLKCMFGTMAKPLHAGKAAMNGLMAAQLAARGFTAHQAGIECEQGFARTQATAATPLAATLDMSAGFAIEATLFKYHAACYLTHSSIEAIRMLRAQHGVGLDDLDSMTITVAPNHRGVCDIAAPDTGLALKFSLQQLAVLALDGVATDRLDLYSDATACDARYARARAQVNLQFVDSDKRNAADVTLGTRDGRVLHQHANVAVPATDLPAQWERLVAKAQAIAGPVLNDRFAALVDAVRELHAAPSILPLLKTIR
jgi:2-methylcitrate dehydratase PrpD